MLLELLCTELPSIWPAVMGGPLTRAAGKQDWRLRKEYPELATCHRQGGASFCPAGAAVGGADLHPACCNGRPLASSINTC